VTIARHVLPRLYESGIIHLYPRRRSKAKGAAPATRPLPKIKRRTPVVSLDEHPQRVKRPASRRQTGYLNALYARIGLTDTYNVGELSSMDASRLIEDAERRLLIPPTPSSGLTLEEEIKDLFN
jgi:hypothetical protein